MRGHDHVRGHEHEHEHETGSPTGSAEEAVAWVERWAREADDTIEHVRAVAEVISGISATASSPRGEIEVTVGASGELVALQLHDDVNRWDTHDLAAEILRLSAEARGRLGEAAAAAVLDARFAPEDADAVADSYRAAPSEPESPWGRR